ncbi:MAG: hypothetical protein V4689_05280 [Verrucomicrobiota bacterium]
MDQELTRYLNDHLAGSSGALLLIQELADHHDAPEARGFFLDLKEKVEADRSLLKELLERIGQSPSTLLQVAGGVAARIGGIKLMWEQIEPGKLGLFEALEMLALGVQGKRLLWVALGEITSWFPEWRDIDFAELELQAIQQRDDIELWRIEAALDILADVERRSGRNP